MTAQASLLDQICARLDARDMTYRRLDHESGETAVAIAEARGTPLELGVKALLMKTRKEWVLIAVRAHQRTDNRAVRHALGSQKLRFATREELASYGLQPGQVPPFGEPFLPFRLIADRDVLALPELAFTAGSNTESVVMATSDWQALAGPEVFGLT